MLAYDGGQVLDVTGPLEVFAVSAQLLDPQGRLEPAYTVEIVAPNAGPIVTSSGMRIVADRSMRDVRGPVDTLLVSGGLGAFQAMRDAALISWVRRMSLRVRRIASVCTGAFILAEAGLLDGKPATTHWRACADLARRYPRISVQPDPIFVRAGSVFTSAGVTAGIDLALGLVEEDLGREIALSVARMLVMFLRRPGGQSQFSAQLFAQMAQRDPIRDLQAWIADHPEAGLSVNQLARRAAMSPRNFARVFARETGMTPAKFVELSRLDAARRRLEESDDSVEAVAMKCGFGTYESMRRAFVRNLRVAPNAYRARFKAAA